MEKIGLDLCFGWTKVCTDEGEHFKFPTLIAYYTLDSTSEIEVILADGKEYAVGEFAKYQNQKITIATLNELAKYFLVFKKYVLNRSK